jgi:hypothetical protein
MKSDDARIALRHRVHVKVRQVAASESHEVAHCAQVWLKILDWTAIAPDGEGQQRRLSDAQCLGLRPQKDAPREV